MVCERSTFVDYFFIGNVFRDTEGDEEVGESCITKADTTAEAWRGIVITVIIIIVNEFDLGGTVALFIQCYGELVNNVHSYSITQEEMTVKTEKFM